MPDTKEQSATAHAVTVRIPAPLRSYTGDQASASASAEGSTVGAVLDDLTARHPTLREQLYGDDDQLRSFVNVYLGDEDIRHLEGTETPVKEGQELSIIPSVAGG